MTGLKGSTKKPPVWFGGAGVFSFTTLFITGQVKWEVREGYYLPAKYFLNSTGSPSSRLAGVPDAFYFQHLTCTKYALPPHFVRMLFVFHASINFPYVLFYYKKRRATTIYAWEAAWNQCCTSLNFSTDEASNKPFVYINFTQFKGKLYIQMTSTNLKETMKKGLFNLCKILLLFYINNMPLGV